VIAGKIIGEAHFFGDLDEPPLGGRDRRREALRFRQTIRTQLSSVLSKTGMRRQSELAGLLAGIRQFD
jgi:hypothetical protein